MIGLACGRFSGRSLDEFVDPDERSDIRRRSFRRLIRWLETLLRQILIVGVVNPKPAIMHPVPVVAAFSVRSKEMATTAVALS